MEALGQGDTVSTGLWEKILAADHSLEVTFALNRLVGLQGALLLSIGRLQDAVELFSLLSHVSYSLLYIQCLHTPVL